MGKEPHRQPVPVSSQRSRACPTIPPRLAGSATHFLPFNRDGDAGTSPDAKGQSYRTAYLWEEVLQRDSLLDLLAQFIHMQIDEKRDDQGRKVKKETLIFSSRASIS